MKKRSKLTAYLDVIRDKADTMTTFELKKWLFQEFGVDTSVSNLQTFMNKHGIKRSETALHKRRQAYNTSSQAVTAQFNVGFNRIVVNWR